MKDVSESDVPAIIAVAHLLTGEVLMVAVIAFLTLVCWLRVQ